MDGSQQGRAQLDLKVARTHNAESRNPGEVTIFFRPLGLSKVATKICPLSPPRWTRTRREGIARSFVPPIDMFSPSETFSERRLTKFPKRRSEVTLTSTTSTAAADASIIHCQTTRRSLMSRERADGSIGGGGGVKVAFRSGRDRDREAYFPAD